MGSYSLVMTNTEARETELLIRMLAKLAPSLPCQSKEMSTWIRQGLVRLEKRGWIRYLGEDWELTAAGQVLLATGFDVKKVSK